MSLYHEEKNRNQKNGNSNPVEMVTITTSKSDNSLVGAEGVSEYRDIAIVSPGGIAWNPREGLNGQLIKNWGSGLSTAILGVEIETTVEPGEVLLYSDNATIHLKNDGNIYINESIIIEKEGDIRINGIIKAKDFIRE